MLETTSTTATRTATATAPWFASWFDSHYYHKLYAHRDDAEATGFIDALMARLQPRRTAAMLDLGCGAGRHSRYLAAKGYAVTGLDLAAASIRDARRSERPGLRLRFRRHDMRDPFGRDAFDYVLNLFTSFGYFEDAGEHAAVVRNIAHALRFGGRLVLDYLNVAHAEAHVVPEDVRAIDGVTYRITRWSDERCFFKRIVIDDPANEIGPIEHIERVAKFRLADFERIFARHGLVIEAVYGDYALRRYDAQSSPRLILVARRRAGLLPGEILPDAA